MNASEVQIVVNAQLGGITSTRRGWNFESLLVPPREVSLRDSAGNSESVWLVLEEAGDGYAVFYDPNESRFGLASSGVIVVRYPDLMSAIEGM